MTDTVRFASLLLLLVMACGDDSAPDAAMDAGSADADPLDAEPADDSAPADAEPIDADRTDGGPAVWLGELGPHGVGYRTIDIAYERPDGLGDREIVIHVWYPAEDDGGDPPRYAFRWSTVARLGATPLEGPFPVLAYSHGNRGLPDASTFLMEHFASHGWVVFAPRHTGNTTADPERVTSIYYLRPHDVSASLDFLLALPSDDPLAGTVGEPRVVTGHSFGGYTAIALAGATYAVDDVKAQCEAGTFRESVCGELTTEAEAILRAGLRDERFAAAIPMASGDFDLFGAAGVVAIDVPVFRMVASEDGHPVGEPDELFDALDGPTDLRLNLAGGDHQSFTDICARLPGFLDCPLENEPEDEWRLIQLYALAFARRAVLGDETLGAILDGTVAVDPRVILTAK